MLMIKNVMKLCLTLGSIVLANVLVLQVLWLHLLNQILKKEELHRYLKVMMKQQQVVKDIEGLDRILLSLHYLQQSFIVCNYHGYDFTGEKQVDVIYLMKYPTYI